MLALAASSATPEPAQAQPLNCGSYGDRVGDQPLILNNVEVGRVMLFEARGCGWRIHYEMRGEYEAIKCQSENGGWGCGWVVLTDGTTGQAPFGAVCRTLSGQSSCWSDWIWAGTAIVDARISTAWGMAVGHINEVLPHHRRNP
jgi:hypothetical protein